MMFQIISIAVLLISFGWMFFLLKKLNLTLSELIKVYFNELKNSLNFFKMKNSDGYIKTVFSIVTLFLFDLLFITGFFPVIFFGEHLSGILLLIHVAVAPLFALSLMVLLIVSADSNRFNKSDIKFSGSFEFALSGKIKLIFWLIAVVSLPVMLSIILGMYPIYGTEGQKNLLELHRYSVLFLSVLVFLKIGFILRLQNEK